MLKGILQYAHTLLEKSVEKGETVIDATCGNGHDTLFLSKLVGEQGHVIAFDIQQQAIDNTKQRLEQHNRTNVTLIHANHAHIEKYIHEKEHGSIGGAIFNLGYLPRSDKAVITKGETTVQAMKGILKHLKTNGLIVAVIYHGHAGGKEEKNAILKFTTTLDQKHFKVIQYGFINQKNNPPFIVAIQKLKP
ncbi:MAG TPA: class I SAM-dependent methyltransferase [Bacillota bacterium]|nr:class I SAM-dependent methyltransferase [Bacillota bacterium]